MAADKHPYEPIKIPVEEHPLQNYGVATRAIEEARIPYLEEVERGMPVEIDGVGMKIFAPEDLLLRKIYVMREETPDWDDAVSIVEHNGPDLRWPLLERNGLDPLLLTSFLLAAASRLPGKVSLAVVRHHIARALKTISEIEGLTAATMAGTLPKQLTG